MSFEIFSGITDGPVICVSFTRVFAPWLHWTMRSPFSLLPRLILPAYSTQNNVARKCLWNAAWGIWSLRPPLSSQLSSLFKLIELLKLSLWNRFAARITEVLIKDRMQIYSEMCCRLISSALDVPLKAMWRMTQSFREGEERSSGVRSLGVC